ncbi:MarR family transcriptional regulator [Colwellia sp. E2M01]|uniref:MarR family winged helix-turn-helix transcriptional regulator n=1 Tax=Colwellia sp. E2M01 TaxID=2841561 RepID=UPI001C08CE67|nr:MarR family transcriptional regulator [Colwellia sp. E2M01]MBU2872176.1 MarR family transcriptional regulator [Colwellia sp. E2M01]
MELSEAVFNLLHTVRNNITQQVKLLPIDLSLMHLKSLKVISMIEGCTGQKMAEVMGRDKAQINRLIKELVSQDLVIKTHNEHDKRSQILTLSPNGQDAINAFNKIEKQVFERMAKDISTEEISRFINLAETFKNNLKS